MAGRNDPISMKRWRGLFIAVCLTSRLALGQEWKPQRLATGHSVTSASDPRLKIDVPKRAKYLGSSRWLLYGVADCEVHVFVETDQHKVVQRMYWIQFEQYTPDHPEMKYNYSSNRIQKIHGLDFYVRPNFGGNTDPIKPGSDAEHVYEIIRAAGYTMPTDMRNIRLNYLPTDDHRQEVMVIYAEDLAPEGVHWSDLLPGGKAADRWPMMQQELLEHVARRVRFSR